MHSAHKKLLINVIVETEQQIYVYSSTHMCLGPLHTVWISQYDS